MTLLSLLADQNVIPYVNNFFKYLYSNLHCSMIGLTHSTVNLYYQIIILIKI